MSLLGKWQLVVTAVVAILQVIAMLLVAKWKNSQVRVIKKLEQEVHRLNTGLDQSIQLLHRAHEAIVKIHSAHAFLLEYIRLRPKEEPTEIYFTKHAELSACHAELRGLVIAIGDKELLELERKTYSPRGKPEERSPLLDEMSIRGAAQRLHTRIAELLEATIKG